MGRPYRIALAEGRSLQDADGRVWYYGQPQVLELEPHELARYERDRRFAVQHVAVSESGEVLPPRPSRPRSEVRGLTPDPDLGPSSPPADDDLDGDPADDDDPADDEVDEETQDKAPEVPAYSEKVVRLAKAGFNVDRTSRALLEQMATVLGAKGPEGEEPSTAKTKEELAGWITQRQTQILADLSRAGG